MLLVHCDDDVSLAGEVLSYVSFIYLPPASKGWRKVMFSLCPPLWRGGTYLPDRGGTHLPRQGTHLPRWGGTYLGRGYLPSQVGGTYLGRGVPTLAGGYLPWQGVPPLAGWYLPWCRGTYLGRGYLPWQGVPTLVGGTYLGRGGYLPSQCVLAMRRAVCLLRLRRRTFLFIPFFSINNIDTVVSFNL